MLCVKNGKYSVTADTRRGQVQLVWKEGNLNWEWLDRRSTDKSVVETQKVPANTRFERVSEGPKAENDRIYVWFCGSGEYKMYWMQDATEDGEDEIVAQVNQLLANPTETVDALSNILENLGMPESNNSAAAVTAVAATTATGNEDNNNSATGGRLTLADLQGAMAGLQTATPISAPVPLNEVVTPASISSLMEDESVKTRLLELLPENQRSMEHLEENLRSPQVQSTLRSLSQALMPDDTGSLEGYHSVIANFQLDPQDGQAALTTGNPIQAFLDCVLANVNKEEEETKEEETKEDTMEE